MSIEETIQTIVEKSLSHSIPRQMSIAMKDFETILNLRTYSLLEASRVTGIGYKKLYTATRNHVLPSFQDGRITRVRHTDLQEFIESEKLKRKV